MNAIYFQNVQYNDIINLLYFTVLFTLMSVVGFAVIVKCNLFEVAYCYLKFLFL